MSSERIRNMAKSTPRSGCIGTGCFPQGEKRYIVRDKFCPPGKSEENQRFQKPTGLRGKFSKDVENLWKIVETLPAQASGRVFSSSFSSSGLGVSASWVRGRSLSRKGSSSASRGSTSSP